MMLLGEPSSEHSQQFARLAEMAADGMYAALFGGRWQQVLQKLYLAPDNLNQHRFVYFARVDDQIAGMVHCFAGDDNQRLKDRTSRLYMRYAGWQLPRMMVVGFPIRRVMAFMDRLPESHLYIQHLAVHEAFRGRRISQDLLRHAETLAREQSCSHLALDVHTENTVAINVYTKYGFSIDSTSPVVHLDGHPLSLHRMLKPLD